MSNRPETTRPCPISSRIGAVSVGQQAVVGALHEVAVDRGDIHVTVVHTLDDQGACRSVRRCYAYVHGAVVDVGQQRAGGLLCGLDGVRGRHYAGHYGGQCGRR